MIKLTIHVLDEVARSTVSVDICRLTINAIEKYMNNCQPEYIEHWKKKRAEMFKRMIEIQLETFDCGQRCQLCGGAIGDNISICRDCDFQTG